MRIGSVTDTVNCTMATSMNSLPLLDQPPGWLISMVLAAEHQMQHKTMFRTCTKLKQMILDLSEAIRPTLSVKLGLLEQEGGHLPTQALAMAEAACPQLHLKLEDTCANPAALSLLLYSAARIHRSQQLQKPPASLQLNCITVVSIASRPQRPVKLPSLLPDVLVQCCPNLHDLSLTGIRIGGDYCTPQLTCTSLQKLSLHGYFDITEGFKQHLLDLPSLTELNLGSYTGELREYKKGGMFWAAISRYSSQLRRLSFGWFDDMSGLPWSRTTQLPLLQVLDTEWEIQDDATMQQLLRTAPNLKRLSLWSISGLTRSFAHVPCSWQELRLSHVYLGGLSKLPLSSCTRLECLDFVAVRATHEENPTPEQVAAGVSAAQAAGGVHFHYDDVNIWLYSNNVGLLAAAAPLLQHPNSHVELHVYGINVREKANWSECRSLLAELGQHLKCQSLYLHWDEWLENPGAAAQVPQLLPQVEAFDDFFIDENERVELAHMVRAASRPFALRIVHDDLRAELEQVMQEAGHQLVSFR